MDTKTKEDRLEEVGKAAYESIVNMVEALECDYARLEELEEAAMSGPIPDEDVAEMIELRKAANGNEPPEYTCKSYDEARERIQDDALSVEVRYGWTTPGEPMEAEEFCLLLTTGGPAVRIRGALDENREPMRAWLEVQDWGTPWTQYFEAEQETLLTYARCFYFGD